VVCAMTGSAPRQFSRATGKSWHKLTRRLTLPGCPGHAG
jgi:hypothetical protein